MKKSGYSLLVESAIRRRRRLEDGLSRVVIVLGWAGVGTGPSLLRVSTIVRRHVCFVHEAEQTILSFGVLEEKKVDARLR